ncbi:hypothetical protein PATA110616_08050 [Paenibacillus tarimensis]
MGIIVQTLLISDKKKTGSGKPEPVFFCNYSLINLLAKQYSAD